MYYTLYNMHTDINDVQHQMYLCLPPDPFTPTTHSCSNSPPSPPPHTHKRLCPACHLAVLNSSSPPHLTPPPPPHVTHYITPPAAPPPPWPSGHALPDPPCPPGPPPTPFGPQVTHYLTNLISRRFEFQADGFAVRQVWVWPLGHVGGGGPACCFDCLFLPGMCICVPLPLPASTSVVCICVSLPLPASTSVTPLTLDPGPWTLHLPPNQALGPALREALLRLEETNKSTVNVDAWCVRACMCVHACVFGGACWGRSIIVCACI